jgi:hypothetical protein
MIYLVYRRIPLTSEQKALITQATADEPEGMAAWARAVLLDAARRQINKSRKIEQTQKSSSDASGKPESPLDLA